MAVAGKLSAVTENVFILKVPLPNREDDITDLLDAIEGEDAKRDAFLGILATEERFVWPSMGGQTPKASGLLGSIKTGAELQLMDLRVEWVLEKLIPERSLTLLHGPGGLGKTWLGLAMAKAVSEGTPFLGLETKRRPVVYIDFENPLPMLIDRVRALDIKEVRFWHLSAERRPPKIDGTEWELYKTLAAGSLLIFDTARAAFDGEENSSQDVALAMGRFKELRELGNEILLLHHTTKLNEKASKGSTAWDDLADNVLAFYRVRPGTFEEIEDEGFDPDALLHLGTGKKSRYERFKVFLTMDPSGGGFVKAQDPSEEALQALAGFIAGEGMGKNQKEVRAWARENLGGGRTANLLALLRRGEKQGLWTTSRGLHGKVIYGR